MIAVGARAGRVRTLCVACASRVPLQDKTVQNTKAKDRHRESVENLGISQRLRGLECGKPVEIEFMTRALALSLLLGIAACTKVYETPAAPTPTPAPAVTPTPTPTPPVVVTTRIEFRVTGSVAALVRADDGLDGLTELSTALPYSQVTTITGTDPIFLSLSAEGASAGFLHVAIFVNGVIFRDAATATLAAAPRVEVDGTFRPH